MSSNGWYSTAVARERREGKLDESFEFLRFVHPLTGGPLSVFKTRFIPLCGALYAGQSHGKYSCGEDVLHRRALGWMFRRAALTSILRAFGGGRKGRR